MTKRNRGKQSSDDTWFAPKWHPVFTKAVDDLCHLLSRGYAANSGLELVGNRYKLNKRQRNAILRVSASDEESKLRTERACSIGDLKNAVVEIDGFNLLILLEGALSGAYIFKARDGLYRDISSVHGSYKRVMKTEMALHLVGEVLKEMGVGAVKWYFDQPVSNSGRLKTRLYEISEEKGYDWEVELVFDPDKVLVGSKSIVISSDGWILDNVERWFNLGAYIIEGYLRDANVLEL